MVDLLPVHRAGEVLIQRAQGSEAVLAKVAAVAIAIPCSTSGQSSRSGLILIPSDLLCSEHMVRVDLAAILIDLLAIDAGYAGA